MEVIKLTTKTDKSGCLNLNIPTQLRAVEVNVVLVLDPISSVDKQELNYDFSDLVGRLTFGGDAVAMQRNLRDEW
ncbi:MAG: hypothetical protein F6K10_26820 [Moorea sp. SIO2B7]|nr:hypothetical protein [Moorena sp. SIO2B7]